MIQQTINQIVYDLRGCAFEIMSEYHYGFSESVYEAALELLMTDKGYKVDRQKDIQCYYKGRPTKQHYRMDLVINDDFIVELKAVTTLLPEHRAQLFNYCLLFNKENCLLLNFGYNGVQSEWYHYDLKAHKPTYLNK